MLAHLARHGLAGDLFDGQASRGNAYRLSVPDFPRTYRRIIEGEALAIGGRTWRVIMGYGHAPEHASLYCQELGVLISGDMLLPRISTNISVNQVDPDANPLALFLASLHRYTEVIGGDPLVVDPPVVDSAGCRPAGPSFARVALRGMRERVGQLEAHHAARLEELEDACAEPKSPADVIARSSPQAGRAPDLFRDGRIARPSQLPHARRALRPARGRRRRGALRARRGAPDAGPPGERGSAIGAQDADLAQRRGEAHEREGSGAARERVRTGRRDDE